MRLSILEMLEAVSDSVFRSIIRFFDNRFRPKDNPFESYRDEISYLRRRNDELVGFILDSLEPKTAESGEPANAIEEELKSIGRPIETTIQRRKRLENESLASWNRLVQEAKDKAFAQASSKSKTTEELELETLGVKN